MTNTEFFDDPVAVVGTIDSQGQSTIRTFSWQEQQFTVVAVGRQWEDEAGRHLMVEAADGTRFELLLRRRDLVWSVQKVWRAQIAA